MRRADLVSVRSGVSVSLNALFSLTTSLYVFAVVPLADALVNFDFELARFDASAMFVPRLVFFEVALNALPFLLPESERDEYDVFFDVLKLLPLEGLLRLLVEDRRLLKLRPRRAHASSAQKSSPAKRANSVMRLTHKKDFFICISFINRQTV